MVCRHDGLDGGQPVRRLEVARLSILAEVQARKERIAALGFPCASHGGDVSLECFELGGLSRSRRTVFCRTLGNDFGKFGVLGDNRVVRVQRLLAHLPVP